MFEAKLNQGSLLKKVLESVKELVTEANFDCAPTGFTMQAMDSSHVSLVALNLRADGFEEYRCDRPIIMGMNLNNMAKMLKCAGNDDVVTIKADDRPDSVLFVFENPDKDRISDFDLKLIDIDSENLGIPDTEHSASVTMSSAEFQRICRDLGTLGDTVTLDVTKDSIMFSTFGDIGNANIALKHDPAVDKKEDGIEIELLEPVNLTFALRYLNSFAKATPLSDKVTLSMSRDAPIEVRYLIPDIGYVKYYLAPKIEEDDE